MHDVRAVESSYPPCRMIDGDDPKRAAREIVAALQDLGALTPEAHHRRPIGGAIRTLAPERDVFVACETDEDMPYLTQYIGEDHLLTGSDYGHIDQSAEFTLVQDLRSRADVPGRVMDKILCTNARGLYSL